MIVHLGGTVGGYLHFALVEHERCALHGELVHAGDTEPAAGRAAPPAERTADAGPVVSAASGSPEDSHDPCAVTAALSSRAAAPQPDGGRPVDPPRVDGAAAAAESPFLASRAGYRMAPKTSPPRA